MVDPSILVKSTIWSGYNQSLSKRGINLILIHISDPGRWQYKSLDLWRRVKRAWNDDICTIAYQTNTNASLKGTVSVILSDPPYKDSNARFTTVPLKPSLIKITVGLLTRKVFISLSFFIASYKQIALTVLLYWRDTWKYVNNPFKQFLFLWMSLCIA